MKNEVKRKIRWRSFIQYNSLRQTKKPQKTVLHKFGGLGAIIGDLCTYSFVCLSLRMQPGVLHLSMGHSIRRQVIWVTSHRLSTIPPERKKKRPPLFKGTLANLTARGERESTLQHQGKEANRMLGSTRSRLMSTRLWAGMGVGVFSMDSTPNTTG